MQDLFEQNGVGSQSLIRLIAFWTSFTGGYEGLRCGCLIDWIIEKVGIEVWLTIPGVVEVGRVGTINSVVLENVSKTIGMNAGLEILIVIEPAYTSFASKLYWIVHKKQQGYQRTGVIASTDCAGHGLSRCSVACLNPLLS